MFGNLKTSRWDLVQGLVHHFTSYNNDNILISGNKFHLYREKIAIKPQSPFIIKITEYHGGDNCSITSRNQLS